jgi:predicted dehydrogenase
MRVGLVGLGSIAPYFVRALDGDPAVTLAAVCDIDPVARQRYADRGLPAYPDAAELLGGGEVDAIVLTLPNDLHHPVAAAALGRGIPVCCEKPLTIEPAEAADLVRLSRASGAVLFTAFHRRYNDNLRALPDRLPDSVPVTGIRCRYRENIEEHTGGDTWYLDRDRCGGGCVIDNGPNALDAVRSLFGPLRLSGAEVWDVRSGVEFAARLELRAADGVPVEIELDWALPTGETKDVTVTLADGRTVVADMLAGHSGFKQSLEHEYAGIVADFRRAVGAGGAHGDDGAEIVALVDEAYRLSGQRRPRPGTARAARS